jgi:hypothetical protein
MRGVRSMMRFVQELVENISLSERGRWGNREIIAIAADSSAKLQPRSDN